MIGVAVTLAALCAACLALLLRGWLLPLWRGQADRPGLPPLWRAVWPWLDSIARSGWLFLSWRSRARLRRLLERTGLERLLTPAHVIAASYLSALCAAAVALLLAGLWGAQAGSRMWLTAGLIGAGLGAALPRHALRGRARTRARRMEKELPFLLDMATLCVEAGLNLQGALQQAVEYGPPGPLRDELQWALGDMRAGMARLDALHAWTVRTDLHGVRILVTALAQADSLGMSLGPILRVQAEQRRAERFQRAERQAMRAPVKMLLPLLTCIFPCTFVVLGFPIVMQLREALQ
ncbi:type II secretion system F family protein [Bordetella sp. LUAb4]|uniref:type II secretion system F family protein n=1 Tax=Bordetella sp. LUAb4 TaxID=2843195 RepID=UPI001E3B4F77